MGKKLYSPQEGGLPAREEVEEIYKWDLTHIYPSDEKWEENFNKISLEYIRYKDFEGRLSESPSVLLECLKFDDSIGTELEKLYLYAMLNRDSDMRVSKYQSMDDRIRNLESKMSAAASFIRPELLSIPDEKLLEMVNSSDDLKVYKHSLENLLRTKTHTLSKSEEEILALSGEPLSVPYKAFSMFTNADMKFPLIKDEEGNDVEISHARYYSAMYSKNSEYRKNAFVSYYKTYKDYVNTLISLFNGNLKSKIFIAKARKYSSAREASLDSNNIPVSVYDNLVSTVNKNLAPLHRWCGLKKKMLGIDEIHPYDTYVSLFPSMPEKKYSYEEAKAIILKSLAPMGEAYINSIQTAFENRWIDVLETQGKRSGAYSSGTTFGVHPYVLLNWSGLMNDVFTLAHEMGHNMHSYYTGNSQPYPYANYTIFVAEVASTFNENLLLDYFIQHAGSKEEKLYFIEKYINNITTTFYRQVMFAEFENDVYTKTEEGTALTPDLLRQMYKELYAKYWGPEMVVDEEEEFTWARVPHFYYNFYVYQYATGFAASEALAKKVKENGQQAIDKYLNFLKAGSSDYSINILRNAGVDMNSPEPILAVTQKINNLLDEFEK